MRGASPPRRSARHPGFSIFGRNKSDRGRGSESEHLFVILPALPRMGGHGRPRSLLRSSASALAWQRPHSPARFAGSFVPPLLSGTTWCTPAPGSVDHEPPRSTAMTAPHAAHLPPCRPSTACRALGHAGSRYADRHGSPPLSRREHPHLAPGGTRPPHRLQNVHVLATASPPRKGKAAPKGGLAAVERMKNPQPAALRGRKGWGTSPLAP